ncbi:acyl carrier protein [Plantactinospora sp. B5E13]|uniref:acyl carrier protein n=1 Tax=unclassified Plantactinospora TaxID=2631981 RepID=UPI00325C9373
MTDQLATTVENSRPLDKEDLRRLIAEVLDVETDEVSDQAHFADDLDVDSLMALEIAVRLEKAYRVKVAESEMTAITTLDGTYRLLERKLQGAA